MKKLVSKIVPEVDRSIRTVDGLISDVMEIGSDSVCLTSHPVDPEQIIHESLEEIRKVHSQMSIEYRTDLRHLHKVNVNSQKIMRVFSNILENAFQAMNFQGKVWFTTREDRKFVTFCIGNSNSLVSPENLPNLFDAFFTSGKIGGTGLGLAISQKVVNAHGGRIWCESSCDATFPDGKVEFFFTLPVSAVPKSRVFASLTLKSREAKDDFFESASLKRERTLLWDRMTDLNRPEIAIVEDNVFIRESWEQILGQDAIVHSFDSPESLRLSIDSDSKLLGRLSCVVTDYYFDDSNETGLDVGRMLKTLRPDLQVILSSDGYFQKANFSDVIDRVVGKCPMSYECLVRQLQ